MKRHDGQAGEHSGIPARSFGVDPKGGLILRVELPELYKQSAALG